MRHRDRRKAAKRFDDLESCLSIPGVEGKVIRATRIRVRAQDENGEPFEEDLEDMYAVCVQHEMDHLDGNLFVDYLSEAKRQRIRMPRAVRPRSGDPAATTTSWTSTSSEPISSTRSAGLPSITRLP